VAIPEILTSKNEIESDKYQEKKEIILFLLGILASIFLASFLKKRQCL
jgi:hypothetical protein